MILLDTLNTAADLPVSTRFVEDDNPVGHCTVMILAPTTLMQREDHYHWHQDLVLCWIEAEAWKMRASDDVPPYSDDFDPDCFEPLVHLYNSSSYLREKDFVEVCDLQVSTSSLASPRCL